MFRRKNGASPLQTKDERVSSSSGFLRRLSLVSRLSPLVLVLLLAPASHAQQNVTVDAVKKRAELNSAKADLEEARRKRDMAVAAR